MELRSQRKDINNGSAGDFPCNKPSNIPGGNRRGNIPQLPQPLDIPSYIPLIEGTDGLHDEINNLIMSNEFSTAISGPGHNPTNGMDPSLVARSPVQWVLNQDDIPNRVQVSIIGPTNQVSSDGIVQGPLDLIRSVDAQVSIGQTFSVPPNTSTVHSLGPPLTSSMDTGGVQPRSSNNPWGEIPAPEVSSHNLFEDLRTSSRVNTSRGNYTSEQIQGLTFGSTTPLSSRIPTPMDPQSPHWDSMSIGANGQGSSHGLNTSNHSSRDSSPNSTAPVQGTDVLHDEINSLIVSNEYSTPISNSGHIPTIGPTSQVSNYGTVHGPLNLITDVSVQVPIGQTFSVQPNTTTVHNLGPPLSSNMDTGGARPRSSNDPWGEIPAPGISPHNLFEDPMTPQVITSGSAGQVPPYGTAAQGPTLGTVQGPYDLLTEGACPRNSYSPWGEIPETVSRHLPPALMPSVNSPYSSGVILQNKNPLPSETLGSLGSPVHSTFNIGAMLQNEHLHCSLTPSSSSPSAYCSYSTGATQHCEGNFIQGDPTTQMNECLIQPLSYALQYQIATCEQNLFDLLSVWSTPHLPSTMVHNATTFSPGTNYQIINDANNIDQYDPIICKSPPTMDMHIKEDMVPPGIEMSWSGVIMDWPIPTMDMGLPEMDILTPSMDMKSPAGDTNKPCPKVDMSQATMDMLQSGIIVDSHLPVTHSFQPSTMVDIKLKARNMPPLAKQNFSVQSKLLLSLQESKFIHEQQLVVQLHSGSQLIKQAIAVSQQGKFPYVPHWLEKPFRSLLTIKGFSSQLPPPEPPPHME